MEYRVAEIDEEGREAESRTHTTGGTAEGETAALELVAYLMWYSGQNHYRVWFTRGEEPEEWLFDIHRTYNPEL